MSIDLNWATVTTGPDGLALAAAIRDFIDDKFQGVPLPRFIRSVHVHSFEFGATPPEIEIKDICDPLRDFYEKQDDESEEEDDDDDDDDDDESEGGHGRGEEIRGHGSASQWSSGHLEEKRSRPSDRSTNGQSHGIHYGSAAPSRPVGAKSLNAKFPHNANEFGSSILGASTPGIPGGTSNLNYFHSHLATGLSGTQTPLAAVAGAHFPPGLIDYLSYQSGQQHTPSGSSTSRPSTSGQSTSIGGDDGTTAFTGSAIAASQADDDMLVDDGAREPAEPPKRFREARPEDVQTVFRVRYSGDVKLSLTAEILLDYPMPSFVGIPVRLNITGLSFDGVAVLASIRKSAHFCFLSHEDALTSIVPDDQDRERSAHGLKLGGLLQEIKVESEIGQRENGKQVLKNVGKVEKFVLEQVRQIFEDEFVYPSFWTFLV